MRCPMARSDSLDDRRREFVLRALAAGLYAAANPAMAGLRYAH